MNGVPEPYEPGVRVIVRGRQYIVTDYAPHADDYRYTGHPVDLAGSEIHFGHTEALPVRPPTVRGILARAGLDADVFDAEVASIEAANDMVRHEASRSIARTSALDDLLDAVGHAFRMNTLDPDSRASYITWKEATT